MRNLKLNFVSYTKLILHALKYPHCAVVGLLIGREDGSDGLFCTDAVPVLHESASLLTVLESALVSVEAYLPQLSKSHRIIGLYFCNESFSDDSLDQFAVRAVEKIASHFPNAVLLQVINSKLSLDSTEPAIVAYSSSEGKNWKTRKFVIDEEEITLGAVSVATQTKLYRDIVDFENHLDDPTKDFWNSLLVDKIGQLI